jgi:hypothetical protein
MMRAGLEGDNQRRPPSPLTCFRQGNCLRVPIAVLRMPSFANGCSALKYYRSHQRVLPDPTPSSKRKVEGPVHGLALVHQR